MWQPTREMFGDARDSRVDRCRRQNAVPRLGSLQLVRTVSFGALHERQAIIGVIRDLLPGAKATGRVDNGQYCRIAVGE